LVDRWYPQLVHGRFVYETSETMKTTRSRHGWVHMFTTNCLQLNLQLHTIDLARTCRRPTSIFCTVAWQLARFQLTRCIARSLGDSWASCNYDYWSLPVDKMSPQNCPFSCGGSGRDSLCPAESTPTRRVDRFSRFSTTHGCVQQTDRHTDHATYVAIGRINLHSVLVMRPYNNRCSFL